MKASVKNFCRYGRSMDDAFEPSRGCELDSALVGNGEEEHELRRCFVLVPEGPIEVDLQACGPGLQHG